MASSIPEELWVRIFEHLDRLPPSFLQVRNEPGPELTRSACHYLKDVASVCKQWRRIVVPLLFKHVFVRVESIVPLAVDSDASMKAKWTGQMNLRRRNLVDFIETNGLTHAVQSFVLISISPQLDPDPSCTEDVLSTSWAYQAIASFWWNLLSVIDPTRLVLIGSGVDLLSLINAAVPYPSTWTYNGAKFQLLDLRKPKVEATQPALQPQCRLGFLPTRHESLPSGSVVNLRAWNDVTLNEGSYLEAYSTYDYFERGPPDVCYTALDRLVSMMKEWRGETASKVNCYHSFTYVAIFPFARHVALQELLPYVGELDVQIGPPVQSKILCDKSRVGKVDLQDCWQELRVIYFALASSVRTFDMKKAKFPNLRKVRVHDMEIRALQDDLDEIFTQMCLPVWAEYAPGDFTRLASCLPAELV